MGDSIKCIQHVESYVCSSSTALQQNSSIEALVELLKYNSLSLEALVREMELYLTSSNSIIRSRGISLLGELLSKLMLIPLDTTALRSLVIFFTERLADWKALRGALVGCLALLMRKKDVGVVEDSDATAVAQSFFQNLQVQSLGQHDRKLSFQLMECLLDRYPCAITDLGDKLVYGVCEAIDGEKDPQCLLIAFPIVERLAKLYPGPTGPLANFAEELFEVIGSYFPIHFTHRKDENDDLKSEELSRALMLAFASTPLYEPFCIPLLLEKLSSSLPSAKLESFRYLSHCTMKYGQNRMLKHSVAVWTSIKGAVYFSNDSTESEFGVMNFVESDVMIQAFLLLQEVILQNADFVSLVVEDCDLNIFINSLNEYKEFDDISLSEKQRLHSVGHILSTCAKISTQSCNKVFEHFFPLLMDHLGISPGKPFEECFLYEDLSPIKVNFGALYLSINLLESCRDLFVSMDNVELVSDFAHHTSSAMLNIFSSPIVIAFLSAMRSGNIHRSFLHLCVKGLEILATFPGSFPSVSELLYVKILSWFREIVISGRNREWPWKLAMGALVEIGRFISKNWGSQKAVIFEITVVEKIVSLISSDTSALPLPLKLQVAFEIGEIRKEFMHRVLRAVDEALDANLTAVCVHGNHECSEETIRLLDAYSQKILPWSVKTDGSDEIPLRLALRIWNIVENTSNASKNLNSANGRGLLNAISIAMKNTIGCCSEKSQQIIINKASGLLASGSMLDKLQYPCSTVEFSSTDESVASLFAALVIPLYPQTTMPIGKLLLHLFLTGVLNGHVPSSHSLGSLINKLPLITSETASVGSFGLNEALDIVFNRFTRTGLAGNDNCGIDLSILKLNPPSLQSVINIINGLAWIGKGLLMRGHEKIKDISISLLGFLTSDLKDFQPLAEVFDEEEMCQLRRCAGDSFRIIMTDSEECLNQTYHAITRPLYKQRFFSTVIPILLSLVVKSESTITRYMVFRAFAHVVCNAPLAAVLVDAKKLVPMILECLSILGKDSSEKGIVYDVLLVLSGILLEKSGHEVVVQNTPGIVNQLLQLTAYSHLMAIRETAIQCLVAVSELPHTRIYPLRTKVLDALSKALDDPKRAVRQEAVRCRQAWTSML